MKSSRAHGPSDRPQKSQRQSGATDDGRPRTFGLRVPGAAPSGSRAGGFLAATTAAVTDAAAPDAALFAVAASAAEP